MGNNKSDQHKKSRHVGLRKYGLTASEYYIRNNSPTLLNNSRQFDVTMFICRQMLDVIHAHELIVWGGEGVTILFLCIVAFIHYQSQLTIAKYIILIMRQLN